jgi:hypothetical protein
MKMGNGSKGNRVKISNSLLYRDGDRVYIAIVLSHEKGKFRDDPKSGDLPKIFKKTFGKKRILGIANAWRVCVRVFSAADPFEQRIGFCFFIRRYLCRTSLVEK